MKHQFLHQILGGLLVAAIAGTGHAAVRLDVQASPDPARPGERLDLEITVTNDGAFDRNDVTVLLDFPAGIAQLFNTMFDGFCPSTACESGEQAQFDIALLPAGGGITFSTQARVTTTATNGTIIPFNVEVFDDAVSEGTASSSVTVDAGRELELALIDSRDPVLPADAIDYTLTYGVIGTSPGSPNATLTLPIPAGTSFVSASDGGVENLGSIEWSLGNLNPGATGERHATLSVQAGVDTGSILATGATFADDSGNSVSHRTATRVQSDIPLELTVAAGPDPARPGEIMDVELIVTNTGFFDRSGVTLVLEFPDDVAQLFNSQFDGSCPSTACESGERATFDIGTLPAGRGRSFSMPMRPPNVTVDGTVVVLDAHLTDSTGDWRRSGNAFATSAARDLELGLVENRDPVVPGDAIEYTLTYGVIETSPGSFDAALRLPQPAGTTFVSASDGGVFAGGVVEWALGNLNPGTTGERRATFSVDPALDFGAIVVAEATFDDGRPRAVRQRAVTRVQAELPLKLDVIASPDAARPGEILDVELSVTNTGTFDRSGVELAFEFPDDIAQLFNSQFDGACASTACESGETANFIIGTLPAGEGRVYSMPLEPTANAPDGTVIQLEAQVRDSMGDPSEGDTTIVVDDTRLPDLALNESDEPVLAGDTISYTLTYGTLVSGSGAPGTTLEFGLPAGTTFVSASDGGSLVGDVVEWSAGSLNPGAGGDRTVVVQVDPGLPEGTILEARAELWDLSIPSELVRFDESTRVAAPAPLDVDLVVSPLFADPGTTLDLQLSVTNTGSLDRTGVVLRLEVPEGVAQLFNNTFGGSCPSTACEPSETATFDVGTLQVGQTMTYPVPFAIANPTPAGTVINFDALALDSTGFVGNDGAAVMVGSEFDGGRTAGAGGISDGLDGGSPLRIERALTCDDVILTWSDSCLTADNDYAVYQGTIGDFTSYAPRVCSTNGATTVTFTPDPGVSQFYLVVPQNGILEGSYGRDSAGVERPASAGACLPQQIATTCQ